MGQPVDRLGVNMQISASYEPKIDERNNTRRIAVKPSVYSKRCFTVIAHSLLVQQT